MSDHQTIDSHAVPSYQCPKQSLLNQLYIRNIDQVQVQDIPLISRVFGPYCKLRTEFFSIDLCRAWAIHRWKKTRIRNLQYGPKKRG